MEDKLGTKIKCLRERLNMSQQRFGAKVGLSGKTISAYECGKCIPPVRVLNRISNLFEVDLIHSENLTVTFLTKLRDIQSSLDNLYSEITKKLL
jgi:transcriptional regulator with XRE-family HTH domain